MDKLYEWRGVPLELSAKWNETFQSSREGLTLSAGCPVCGEKQLRRFFGSARPFEKSDDNYAGRGASWEWCGACHVYEHASCMVPRWWRPLAGVNEFVLTAKPDVLEEQLKALSLLPG